MPDEYLPPNKILFLQNLPETVTKEQLNALFSQWDSSHPSTLLISHSFLRRYPNLYEVRLIPTKKDIAFVEFMDEGSATVAKEALHNYKLDGENKIKVCLHFDFLYLHIVLTDFPIPDHVCKKVDGILLLFITLYLGCLE
jgi:hypothetical protein